MSAAATPAEVRVRLYQVGFGDCVLVGFRYPEPLEDGRRERHMLVDFGSTRWPEGHRPRYPEIAASIAERTGGRLDAIVVTHRHKDHLSGFADDEAAQTLAGLQPALVVRPWTERPEAAADAAGPPEVGDGARSHLRALAAAQTFSAAVADELAEAPGLSGRLAAFAADQIPNAEAIERLDALASDAAHGGRYLHAGADSGIEAAIPGISVSVLGPPTPDQWPEVTGQRADDPEYWLARGGLLASALERVAPAVPAADRAAVAGAAEADPLDPGPARWLLERMRDQQTGSLLRVVRSLDDALNNTSVVLLVRAGERRLLLPGDAQIENWSYALESPDAPHLRAELPAVDLYKVGHHGSRNATPRSLVRLWEPRRGAIASAMSTMADVHGESEETAVPRATLVAALADLGALHSTESLAPGELFLELGAATAGDARFERVESG